MTVTASVRGIQAFATTWPVLVPDGADTHDQFIMVFFADNTVDAPVVSGWTEQEDFAGTIGNRRLAVYTRTLSGAFTQALQNIVFGSAVSGWWFSGSVNGRFLTSEANEGSWATQHAAPSVVANADQSTLVAAAGVVEFLKAYATPAGTTELQDFASDNDFDVGGVLGTRTVSAGASGQTVFVSSSVNGDPNQASERFLSVSMVFSPIGGGGVPSGNGDPVTVSFAGQDALTANTLPIVRPAGDLGAQALLAINLKDKSTTIALPSGWTLLGEQVSNERPSVTRVYTYDWSAPEVQATDDWGLSATAYTAFGMIVYNGVAALADKQAYDYAESMPTPGATSTKNGSLVAVVVGTGEWPRSVLSPSQWTEHVDVSNGAGPSLAIAARAANIESVVGPVFTPNVGDWYQALTVLIEPLETVTGNYLSGQSELPFFERPRDLRVNSNVNGEVSLSWSLDDSTLATRFYANDGTGRVQLFRDDTEAGIREAVLNLANGTYTLDAVSFMPSDSDSVESARSNAISVVATSVVIGDPDDIVSIRDDGPYFVPATQPVIVITFTAKKGDGSLAANEPLDVINSPSVVQLIGTAVALFEEPASSTDENGQVIVELTPAEFGISGVRISIGALEHTAVVNVESAAGSASGNNTAWSKPLVRRS